MSNPVTVLEDAASRHANHDLREDLLTVLRLLKAHEEAHSARKEHVEALAKFGNGSFMDFRYEREESERIYELEEKANIAYNRLEEIRTGATYRKGDEE